MFQTNGVKQRRISMSILPVVSANMWRYDPARIACVNFDAVNAAHKRIQQHESLAASERDVMLFPSASFFAAFAGSSSDEHVPWLWYIRIHVACLAEGDIHFVRIFCAPPRISRLLSVFTTLKLHNRITGFAITNVYMYDTILYVRY